MQMAARTPAANEKPSQKVVQQALDRILASATFQQVDRLKRFIAFIVSEALAGRGDQLKEYVIGVQVFGKEVAFDPRTDPIVRVQARRLRTRLARYYREEGQNAEVVIDLPKGGYVPVFKRAERAPVLRRSVGATLVSQNTVAVLPFADHSPAGELDYFSRGLREEVIHNLAKFETLRVLAVDTQEIFRCAAVVITGSLRQSGNTVRVTTQLIDGASNYYLWSESVDADLTNALASQEQVARVIVDKFQRELMQPSRAHRPIENLAAHNLYLQGRYHLNQRTEEGLRKALDFFEKALVEDAQSALVAQRPFRHLQSSGALWRARTCRCVGESRVERRLCGDAGRQFGRSAHVARAYEGDAGLGLGRGRARIPESDCAEPAVSHRTPLVCHVVPDAHREAR